MALLYNVCSYSGISGGKYQSVSWDSCCPDWEVKDDQDPLEFTCQVTLPANYSGDGVNGVQWGPGDTGSPEWNLQDHTNPAGWSTYAWSADWTDGDSTNPQSWVYTTGAAEWFCDDPTNPQGFAPETGEGDWAEPTPPEAVEYKPYIRRDQGYCGN